MSDDKPLTCPDCGAGFDSFTDLGMTADGRSVCPECGYDGDADDTSQAVRNALDDLETAADRVESDFDAEAIRQSVATLREELGLPHPFTCGRCGHEFTSETRPNVYCPRCGQRQTGDMEADE